MRSSSTFRLTRTFEVHSDKMAIQAFCDQLVELESNTRRQTCLIDAVEAGDMECVKQMLEAAADVNQADKDGKTPLTKAVGQNELYIVKLLLVAGAHVNQCDNLGQTALMKAAWRNDAGCVKLLLESGADVNSADHFGETAVMEAAWQNASDCMKLLVEAGANVNQADKIGHTPLLKAVWQNSSDCVQLLLENGADVNCAGPDGELPLTEAVKKRHTDCVKMLLDHGADVNKCDKDGRKPLLLAISQGNAICVKVLLEAGADVNPISRDVPDKPKSRFCVFLPKVFRCGWQGGTQAAQNHVKQVPLVKAVRRGHMECAQLLLTAGADVNYHDKAGKSILHQIQEDSLREKCPEKVNPMLKLLVTAGANVNMNLPERFRKVNEPTCLLLFAAGRQEVFLSSAGNTQPGQFLPPDWEDLDLKNQCRKAIRKHLLTLDSHTNLFFRVPQLGMSHDRAGLPSKLTSYLLYNEI